MLASNECDHVLEGEARVGGQEHFYLEPNAAIVIPKEIDEIESFSSTQVRKASAGMLIARVTLFPHLQRHAYGIAVVPTVHRAALDETSSAK